MAVTYTETGIVITEPKAPPTRYERIKAAVNRLTASKPSKVTYRAMRQMTKVSKQQQRAGWRLGASLFPMQPGIVKSSAPGQGTGQGTGRVGRPRGTYAGKYAAYGGVFGYRKAMAQFRRQREMAAEERAIQERLRQMPPQQAAQQAQQVQQAMQAPPPPQYRPRQAQYPQQQQNARPFQPGYQNRTYRPVDMRPLYGDRNSEFIETTDFFTGQRRLVRRIQPEKFMRGY